MAFTAFKSRTLTGAAALALTLCTGSASALEFDVYDITTLKLDNLFTVGASWRMQERDDSLVGKSTVFRMNNPAGTYLCVGRQGDDGVTGPDPNPDNNAFEGDTCTTSDAAANQRFVDAPGSFSPNGDNGNLNFERGDIVHAVAKLTTDLSFELYEFNVFARGIYFFDENYSDLQETHPDTTLQPLNTGMAPAAKDMIDSGFDMLDYNISRSFDVLDRSVSIKLGNQVLNWGESALLFLNSLNTINPPDARRARMPGFDLKEAFQPQGMAVISTDVIENVGLETFYQYEWKPIIVDPVGSFQSVSDTLGAGGRYAMLSFAKAPEDPDNLYRPNQNDGGAGGGDNDDPIGALGSSAGRTVYRNFAEERAREPDGTGQYGAALKVFLEDFNNGTEVAFYYANYHSRLPVVSALAAQDTCLVGGDATSLLLSCGVDLVNRTATEEPIPVDTMSLIVEYPENIKMMGFSFNTTVGDYAFAGEYAYRPNLPIQIHTVDLTYTALQPAFPDADIPIPGVATIPGRQSAFPTFLPRYRGIECGQDEECIAAGEYIRGYERQKVGQGNLTVLRLIGGDNWIGASQVTLLAEMGITNVFDMPEVWELPFQGAEMNTHLSGGADGTGGFEPEAEEGNTRANNLRQNPTAHRDSKGWGKDESYGYRILNLNRWDSALFGINLETLTIIQHDVKGTTPGIGGNFVHGRKQFAEGLRFDYLSKWIGEVRYTWFTGGADRDASRDRDNIFVTLGYQF